MTQTEQILDHMRRYGSISSLEAMEQYNIFRLGARIFELKEAGAKIRSDTVKGKTRDGRVYHYTRYRLED